MKCTFAYDGVLFYDSRGTWYGRDYSTLLKRYNTLSDDITFLMRTTFDDDASKKMSQMPERINVQEVPNILGLREYWLNRSNAEKIIEEQVSKTDFLIIRLPGMISRMALRLALKYKKPYIVEVVGCVWDSLTNHSIKGKLLAPYEFISTRKAIRNSQYVTYVTNEFLQRRYPTNGKCVGISDVELTPIDKRQLDKKLEKYKGKINSIVIGTAGAIDVQYKGQEYVINAIAEIKRQCKLEVFYRIAGTGDSSRLHSIAEKNGVLDRVVFDGSIPHDKMNEWYDSLDIYIQPSSAEGMPRALLEAMGRAVPCFGSKVGGIPELLSSDSVFPIGDTKKIAMIIENLNGDYLYEKANECYQKSQEFIPQVLERRRKDFYTEFLLDQGWRK